jgi:sugar lactone lactonase YvrE
MKIVLTKFIPAAVILLALPILSANAGGKAFPKVVPVLDGSYHEGFAIGKGTTAYSGSPDGSIYKVNLRNGQGEILVPPVVPFDPFDDCYTLGMRLDARSNYLFVAGCFHGNALVYDADTGEEIMQFQLTPEGDSLINDIAITQDAVYFTDFQNPAIYRLPLSKNGRIPEGADAAIAIPLTGDFEVGDNIFDAFANGIVATPDGKTLIIGNSGTSKIFRVDPATGHADEIIVDPPLEEGFIDGIVFRDGVLYILTPYDPAPEDMIQVVLLDDDMLMGTLLGIITDPDLDGVASGGLHGDSLYVNNGRYNLVFGDEALTPDTPFWITKLNIYDVQ